MPKPKSDLLQGTLDLLILKTLELEPMHGWGITRRIQQQSGSVLQVNQGSLYPDQEGQAATGRGDGELGSSLRCGGCDCAGGIMIASIFRYFMRRRKLER